MCDIDFSSVGIEEINDKNEFINKKTVELKQIRDSQNKVNNQMNEWKSKIEKIMIIVQKKNEVDHNISSADNVIRKYFYF